MKYLVDNGADVNDKFYNGKTALMLASKNKRIGEVKF